MTGYSSRSLLAATLVSVAASFAWTSCAEANDDLRGTAKKLFGIVQSPDDSRLARPDVVLGRALFWDKRLSSSGNTACASCHLAEDWGADRRTFSVDAKGKYTGRNAQTVFNATLQPSLRWTGDRKSAAHQAQRSLTGSMGLPTADAVIPLLEELGYESAFRAAFADDKDPVTPANYATAIQAYEATLLTPAPFDKYLSGEDGALSADQKRGLKRFIEVGCADCHSGRLLGGDSLETFGVAKKYWTATKSPKRDAGLFESTKKESDRYKFRVSMLRNVAKTGPYFHDGSVTDLNEAVQVMADVQLGERLADADAEAIVAFLDSLTGDVPRHYAPPAENPKEAKESSRGG